MEKVIERNNVVIAEGAAASGLSAVSWAAVFAGAATAAALSLIMFILGIGLGLGAVSPWSGEGMSGAALGISTILWITLTSLVASAAGGYITGRLRTRWLGVHTDEVFFRDTAHGFLAWGVATLMTAVIFTTATAGVAKMGVQAGAAIAGGVAETATTAAVAGAASGDESSAGGMATPGQSAVSYYLDTLFRTGVMNQVQVNALQVTPATVGNAQPPAPANTQQQQDTPQQGTQQQGTQPQQQAAANTASTEAGAKSLSPAQQAALSAGGASPETMVPPRGARGNAMNQAGGEPVAMAEVTRIFMRSLGRDELTPEDATYVGRLVAQHTGLSEMEAEARVNDVFARTQAELNEMETTAREAADEARAASMKAALWFFVALLGGAFLGSFSATIGGRQRDF